MITTLLIGSYEERDVATFDIPGAYLHDFLPDNKNIIMVLRNEFAEIMCEVNPEYKEHAIHLKNRKTIIYLTVVLAIYGCIELALCWYNLYTTILKDEGFEIKPHCRCIANKDIEGKQCTVAWYVNANKLSHVNSKVVDHVLEIIEGHFRMLLIIRGKTHDFLGMKIRITEDKTTEITMKDQIEEAFEMFGKELKRNGSSPATKKLTIVNPSASQRNNKKSDFIHSVTAKLLFITK